MAFILRSLLLICHFCAFVSCEVACGERENCAWNDVEKRCICPEEVQRSNLSSISNQRTKRDAYCAHYRTQCKSIGDPHIRPFIGNNYQFLKAGVYTLVKLDSRSLWIQVSQSATDWRNCGVMAREGNNIIGITSCYRASPELVEYQLDRNAARGSICKITNGWKIYLVSGIEIEVIKWGNKGKFMQLYVTGLESEVLRYEGLCSVKVQRITECKLKCEQHRVKDSDSFFNIPQGILPKCVIDQMNPQCGCYGRYPYCPQRCSVSVDITDKTNVCSKRKRQNDETGEENDVSKDEVYTDLRDLNNAPMKSEVADRELNMGYRFVDLVRSLNPRQELSVEDGRIRCNAALRLTPTYEICSRIVDTSDIIENCALDENIMKDDEPAQSVPAELETVCLDNISLSIEASMSPAITQELKDLLAKVEKLVCPSQCSQNGRCVDSKCQCNEGFTGADCSLEIGQESVVKK